jgi:hypothetical protein
MAWGVQKGRSRPQGRPRNGHKAISGVAHPQGVEGLGMAGPGETLRSPWLPLAICPWHRPLWGRFPGENSFCVSHIHFHGDLQQVASIIWMVGFSWQSVSGKLGKFCMHCFKALFCKRQEATPSFVAEFFQMLVQEMDFGCFVYDKIVQSWTRVSSPLPFLHQNVIHNHTLMAWGIQRG